MKQISAKEAYQKMDKPDFMILDIRERFEVETASVEKYTHIPMRQLPQKLDELPQDKTIAVLCHHGARSARVTQYLKQQGFDNAVNIQGGIEKWSTSTSSNTPRYTKSMGTARVVS